MSGIFASQFNPVSPYDPVGLDTGTPQVGMTLGKKTPKRSPEKTPAPARVPSSAAPGAEAAASAAAGADFHATAAGSQSAQASNQMSLSQAGSASHMSAANQAANGIGYHPDAAPATNVVMPKHSGADATPPKQNSNSGGGFLGWASHTFDSVTHNPIVSDVMHFGDPFRKSDNGVAGLASPAQQASDVVKPSAVFNPGRNPAGAISQGGPKVIQGSVENQPGVSAPGSNALPRSAAYDNMFRANLGRQFMGNGASTAGDTLSNGGGSLIDSIPNDISELFSSVF